MRPQVCIAERGEYAARDKVCAGLAIVDVEAPHAPAHVAGVHAVGKAVAREVKHADVAGYAVDHRGKLEVSRRVRARIGAPEDVAGDRVHDEDLVAGRVGRVGAVVLDGVIAAAEDQHLLQRILRRRSARHVHPGDRRRGPALAGAGQLLGADLVRADPEQQCRHIAIGHVDAVVVAAAAAHAEVDQHTLAKARLNDAVLVDLIPDGADVAVEAVFAIGDRVVDIEVPGAGQQLRSA